MHKIMKNVHQLRYFFFSAPMFLVSCENSKPVRLYNTAKDLYNDAQETGDYTWLIVFIVLLVIVGLLWLKNKNDKN